MQEPIDQPPTHAPSIQGFRYKGWTFDVSIQEPDSSDGISWSKAFHDHEGNPVDGLECIFPIVQTSADDPWQPLGTGFFITNFGLFVTAKHVLFDSRTGQLTESLGGLHISRIHNRGSIRPIFRVVAHPEADVAVGFLRDVWANDAGVPTTNKCLPIIDRLPQIGDHVAATGFPHPKVISSNANPEVFDLQFETAYLRGEITDHYPSGRDRTMLPGHCFETTMQVLSGASGGPVAYFSGSANGAIFAVNSTGYENIETSFVSSIVDILDLNVPRITLPNGEKREVMSIREMVDHNLIVMR